MGPTDAAIRRIGSRQSIAGPGPSASASGRATHGWMASTRRSPAGDNIAGGHVPARAVDAHARTHRHAWRNDLADRRYPGRSAAG